MLKKALFAVAIFYLLGVFGVAGGYLSSTWDGEWSFGQQVADAIQIGATWPLLVYQMVAGA